ncbi:MAG: glycosyltransferase 87 family protein [Actinomycetes bacterium]
MVRFAGSPLRVALLVVALTVCGAYVLAAATGSLLDFAVYRAGGAAALSGHHLYTAQVSVSGYRFTYPPISALLFAPISWIPQRPAQVAWTLASLVALWWVVRLTLSRYASPKAAANHTWVLGVFVLVAVSDPLRVGLGLGQINVLIALLVLADFCGAVSRLPRGLMIGVAAAVKLTPLFLIAYLLAVRRIRDATWAAGTFLVVTAGAFVVMPAASADFWLRGYISDLTHFGLGYVSNQSVNGLVVRLLESPSHAKLFWFPAALFVTLVVLLTARRTEPARPWLAEAMALGGMVAVSPVSWAHHWILVLPLVVACTRLGTDRRYREVEWLALALAAVLMLRVVWMVTTTYRHSPWQFLLGSADILLLLATLGTLAWKLRTRSAQAGEAHGAAPSRGIHRPDP